MTPRATAPHSLLLGAIIALAACGGSGAPTTPTASTPPTMNTNLVLATCGPLNVPGATYRLETDLTSSDVGRCLVVVGHDLTLDCAGHSVPFVSLSGSSDIVVNNCKIGPTSGPVELPSGLETNAYTMQGLFLLIQTSNNVTVKNSTLTGVAVVGGQQHVIDSNHVTAGGIAVGFASRVTISNNNIDNFLVMGIRLVKDVQITVTNNTVENGGRGDDAIELDDQTDDVITGNRLSAVSDAGIEGNYAVRNTLIEGNTITDTPVAVGSFYGTNWQNNTIRNNTASGVRRFAWFQYDAGSQSDQAFMNNLFDRNILVSFGRPGFPSPVACLWIDFQALASSDAFGGNMIVNNSFPTASGPAYLMPERAFINGGGNTCASGPYLKC